MKKVLLVDDELMIVRVLTRFLTKEGYAVTAAGSGAEALQLFKEGQPFHVLLCDVYLGSDDGWEVAEKIYVADPTIHVLMLSGARGDRAPQRLVYSMLYKPFNRDDLLDAIKALEG